MGDNHATACKVSGGQEKSFNSKLRKLAQRLSGAIIVALSVALGGKKTAKCKGNLIRLPFHDMTWLHLLAKRLSGGCRMKSPVSRLSFSSQCCGLYMSLSDLRTLYAIWKLREVREADSIAA